MSHLHPLALVYARGWAANSVNKRVRLQAQLEGARSEISQLKEELRIKDARMGKIDPLRRPHYPPIYRMAILEVKAARGWSQAETARRFLVMPSTIASWLGEKNPSALVQVREPGNRFPDLVRYIVRRLKILCPTMGKKGIAQILSRAGLRLAVTTVGRIIEERPGTFRMRGQ